MYKGRLYQTKRYNKPPFIRRTKTDELTIFERNFRGIQKIFDKRHILDLIPKKSKTLDIGSGTLELVKYLAYYLELKEIHCTDIVEQNPETIKFKTEKMPKIVFFQGRIGKINEDIDYNYKLITCFMSIHHFGLKLLEKKILPRTRKYILINDHDVDKRDVKLIKHLINVHKCYDEVFNPKYLFSRKDLHELMKKNNFKVVISWDDPKRIYENNYVDLFKRI